MSRRPSSGLSMHFGSVKVSHRDPAEVVPSLLDVLG